MKKLTRTLLMTVLGIMFSVALVLGVTACRQGIREGTEYTVHFVTNCSNKAADRTYVYGSTFNLPTPYNFGYDLEGWYYDSEFTVRVETTNNSVSELNVREYADSNREITLYANWKVGEYKIVFETGTDETIEDMTVKVGETVTLPTPKDQVKGTNAYPFSSWYYTASGSYHTDTFTLTYPEDVYMQARYDYGVQPTWEVDDNGRYHLASATRSATLIDGLELVYGTIEGTITVEKFDATGCGFIWNADLGSAATPWETGTRYYYFHMNMTSGAISLARVETSFTNLIVVTLANNTTGYKTKFETAKAEEAVMEISIKIEFSEEETRLYIDDELQITGTGVAPSISGATGVGFRAMTGNIYFSDVEVTNSAYQVTLDATGGSLDVDYLRAADDATITAEQLPKPFRAGYEFLGWFREDGTKFTETTAGVSEALHAEWEQYPNGALVTFEGSDSSESKLVWTANGEKIGTLPVLEKLGFTLVGWYYMDGESEVQVTEDTVFAAEDYDGDTKQISVYAKWTKDANVSVTEITLTGERGSYSADPQYDGYTAYTAGVGSLTTFANVTLAEGRYSTYVKFADSGANGIIFGATIASDFGSTSDDEYKAAGSSYYYWHINNGTGVWQLAKVTDPSNPDTTNASSPGYDVLAQATISGFVAGGRYLLTVEFYQIEGGRYIALYVNGELIREIYDNTNVGGAALTGAQLGFRNAGGGATYYGISVLGADAIGGATITLNAGGGKVNESATAEYKRPVGWSVSLPAAELEGSVFVGWTTVEGDATTFFEGATMLEEYNGITLYAYYVGDTQTLVYLHANGGKVANDFVLVTKGTALTEDLTAATRTGYKFLGWFDENGTEIKTGSTLTQSVVDLTAKWGALEGEFAKASQVVIEGNFTSANDGVYDVFTSNGTSLVLLDQTLASGEITFYTTVTVASGNNGILFGGTNIGSMTSPGDVDNATYYYWHLNNASGAWQLAKIHDYPANKNYEVLNMAVGASWKNAYGEDWAAGTYKMTVRMEKLESGALLITLFVNDRQFFSCTDNSPLTGTQIALRSINSPVRTYWAIQATAEAALASGTLTLNAGEGTTEGSVTQIVKPTGWTFTLPAATHAAGNFLGWATEADGEVKYQPGSYTMGEEFAGKTLYAVYTTQSIITFVSSIGTAPNAQTVAIGALAETPAALQATGYVFNGWFDEGGVEIKEGYVIRGNVTATAKWSAVVTNPVTAENVYTNANAYLTKTNNGIYDLYTVTGPSVAKFSDTLETGTLTAYLTFNTTSQRGGLLFRATALENMTNMTTTNNTLANFYYWYVNATNSGGGWILYKCDSGKLTTINNLVSGGTTVWKNVYGEDFSNTATYRFEVKLETVAEGLKISLSVDGKPFLEYTDTAPLTGTQIGYLNNANATSTTIFGLSATPTGGQAVASSLSEITLYSDPKRS